MGKKKLFGGTVGRVIAGVATGGLSEVARAAGDVLSPNTPNINIPQPEEPPVPGLPDGERELNPEDIGVRAREAKGVALVAPGYLGLSGSQTPLQQRTSIATQATQGDLGQDPAALGYYRQLAFRTLSEPGAEPLPVEQSYLGLFGEQPRSPGAAGFLSALERIYQRVQ